MVDRYDIWAVLGALATDLGEALGPHCEVVLHDLSRPESSIVAIAHGDITGRHVGDGITSFGLEVLGDLRKAQSQFHYRTRNKTGKPLRSSSLFLRNSAGVPFAALCLNWEIEPYQVAIDVLQQFVQTTDTVAESFASDIRDLITSLIEEAVRDRQKPVAAMTRADKEAVVEHLVARGIFEVKGAVDLVAIMLGTSRVTVYSYLREVRARQRQAVI